MKMARSAASLLGLAMLFCLADVDLAQPPPPAPVQRALPADESVEPKPTAEGEQPEKRQLEYASDLFARKMYDLSVPELQ